jgi:cell division protein FtsL
MKFFTVTFATVAALVLCLLNVVELRHVYYSTGYEIARATRDQRTLEDDRKQLLIDRAALLDPGRLTPIAARHGFKVATADQIVIVGAPQDPPPVAPSAASAAPAAPKEH